MLNGATILVTGGTGSFGQAFVRTVLNRFSPRKLIVFSRDEAKQYDMQQAFSISAYPCMRFFLGDVRDRDRLRRAFAGVDYVVHTAALKQVPSAEYNPFEAVKTNILGAQNIIEAAIDTGVKRVLALSTDKAANPINLYGATKLCSDKLFIAGNTYASEGNTVFSVVRYGNVIGSRGSVVLFFLKERGKGVLPITDPRMTRFWITLQRGVDFVLWCLEHMSGGELFVPRLPSMNIMDLARAVAPECDSEIVGIRAGEKIHEVLIPKDDARHTLEFDDFFIIQPKFRFWVNHSNWEGGRPVGEDFEYDSESNPWQLGIQEMQQTLADLEPSVTPSIQPR